MEPKNSDALPDRLPPDDDRRLAGLDDAIASLGRSFESHPGFMWTDAGFEVLHADWPAYPRGHGIAVTLGSVAEYPLGTQFFPIDNIDECTLFAVGEKPKQARNNRQLLHLAAWDDDLRACASARYVAGILDNEAYLMFPDGSMKLTQKGAHAATVDALLQPANDLIAAEVIDHLREARYDTAIREASLRVEIGLRRASGLPDHGRRLIERCFGDAGVLVPKGLTNVSPQLLRNMLHGYFTYVRNEYAHNLPSVDLLTACTLVRRSAALLRAIAALDASRRHDG